MNQSKISKQIRDNCCGTTCCKVDIATQVERLEAQYDALVMPSAGSLKLENILEKSMGDIEGACSRLNQDCSQDLVKVNLKGKLLECLNLLHASLDIAKGLDVDKH